MNIISQLFDSCKQAKLCSQTALKWKEGSWTYSNLFEMVQQSSIFLKACGIQPDNRIVLQCTDTVKFIACYFAVINIGAVAVAVSTRLNVNELAYVAKNSNAVALVFDSTTELICKEVLAQIESGPFGISIDEIPVNQNDSASIQPVSRTDQQEALWVYSSGTTSYPKGIVHTHKDLGRCCDFHRNTLNLQPSDLIFCTSKLSFAYSLANALLAPLILGATVYIYPDWIKMERVEKILKNEQPKVLFAVPSIYRDLIKRFSSSINSNDLGTKYFVSAGEHLAADIQRQWQKLTGKTVINVYGCSETLFLAFAGNDRETPDNSVGKPLAGVEPLLLSDSEVVPENSSEKGVLHLSHPFMFSYYANRKKETEVRIKKDRFVTGDLYQRDKDGYWYHMGREDELIKVAGQWVYLRDIERLSLDCNAVFDAAVVSANDDAGMLRPALFFVPENHHDNMKSLRRLRRHIQQNLPRIKWPGWIRLVHELPRTANGKISRHQLHKLVQGTTRD